MNIFSQQNRIRDVRSVCVEPVSVLFLTVGNDELGGGERKVRGQEIPLLTFLFVL